MTEPKDEDPPREPPRASDIAEGSGYVDGLIRWADLGPRARALVQSWGEAPDEAADEAAS